ncbi:MAG: NAD(P)-dependent oxidoreductase [Bacillota bacterium]
MIDVSSQDTVVGFVGCGVMGQGMASNLLEAGYPINLYTRTRSRAAEVLDKGATWRDSVAEVAANADVIITIVGFPTDVQEVYFGESGILENARPGSYVIDMTTSKPSLSEEIAERARARDIHALDAPVSGGDVGARDGTLTIMVGGSEEAFESCLPILEVMGRNILLQGPPGAGQHTKMCNQIAIASNMLGVCEAIAYAENAGLDPETVLESIGSGAAGSWSLSNLAPRMLADNFAPGFYVKHFIKDMTIALESAREMGLMTPGLELSLSLYQRLAKQGDEDAGTQALIKLFRQS